MKKLNESPKEGRKDFFRVKTGGYKCELFPYCDHTTGENYGVCAEKIYIYLEVMHYLRYACVQRRFGGADHIIYSETSAPKKKKQKKKEKTEFFQFVGNCH